MSTPQALSRQTKLEKLQLLEAKRKLQEGLPHLYAYPWYTWAKQFFDSTNKVNLLCAGNQISKSSSQIRKCVEWATNTKKWENLWRHKPRQFWYMYPSIKQVRIEFETKWVQFLPTGEYKEHPQHGWKAVWKNGELVAIKFNSGVNVYFKVYSQSVTVLQSATVDAIFADEEMPEELYPELMMRLTASNGYFHMVFTATLGQEFWRKAIEPKEYEEEVLPEAAKWQVGMYDCQFYDDGTLTQWTDDHIQMIKSRCGSQEEILKRVYGRFIMERTGKKYHQFDLKRHVTTPIPVPDDWIIYEGVDIGSGSAGARKDGHPSAICFTAVNPTHTRGRVILGWRGDAQKTTAGDVLNKHFELKKQLRKETYLQFYDGASADFKTIADSQNEPFIPAEKNHETGEQIVNTLFKNDMLTIDDTDVLRLLAIELTQLDKGTPKNKSKDDFADAFRYSLTKIPWDWSVIKGDKPFGIDSLKVAEEELTETEIALKARREGFNAREVEEYGVSEEIAHYNELLDYGP